MGFDVDGLLASECAAALQTLYGAAENRLEVVRRCLQNERVHRVFCDRKVQAMLPSVLRGMHPLVMFGMSPAMLALFLEFGMSANDRFEDGSTPLDVFIELRSVEHMRHHHRLY